MILEFSQVFEAFGWAINYIYKDNYIAFNDTYFIPFSIKKDKIDAISFYIPYMDEFIESWKELNKMRKYSIGNFAFDVYCDYSHIYKCDSVGPIAQLSIDKYKLIRCLDKINKYDNNLIIN